MVCEFYEHCLIKGCGSEVAKDRECPPKFEEVLWIVKNEATALIAMWIMSGEKQNLIKMK